MTPSPGASPQVRDLALIGGGHAHALVLRAWTMSPVPGARLSLVTPELKTAYSGMLPGAVAGLYRRDEIFIDLAPLAEAAGARLILGRATGLDPDARTIPIAGRARPLGYDVVSFDTGSVAAAPDLDDPAGRITPVRPASNFLDAWEAFVARAAEGGPARAAIIGAGAGGVELAFAAAARLRAAAGDRAQVALIGRAPEPSPGGPRGLSRALARRLSARGVVLALGRPAAAVDADGILLEGGARVAADFIALAAGPKAPAWLERTGLTLDADGFIAVDPSLRSISHASVFAAGDVATILPRPRDKAGVFAVRSAKPLGANLVRALRDAPPRPAALQTRYLKLISLGDGAAVAQRGGVGVFGPRVLETALWRWKDRIDRRFMARLRPAPRRLAAPAVPRGAAAGLDAVLSRPPLCAGCGSKVGRGVLSEALGGPFGDDAAVLALAGSDAALVASVDQIRAPVGDPERAGRIAVAHAFGDVFAMGAQPEAALLSVTTPPLSEALQARTLGDVIAGAEAALAQIGARLVGGHSAEGAELSIGVTALGRAGGADLTPLSGARPGDRLLLTRPLGAGVLLAGQMRLMTDGDALAALYTDLAAPVQADAERLRRAGARAMTDVTGFGLAGHLCSLLEASGCGARLRLDAIPLRPGAAALAAAGVRSSLFEANRAAAAPALGSDLPDSGAVADLLFDPQTTGGVLAALPPERDAAGLGAEIGVLTDGPVRIELF